MQHRRGWVAVAVVGVALSTTVLAQKDKKQDEAQKREIQSVVKIVDAVAAGQPAPNDLSISWVREDMLKAQGNKEYVPFTVSIDPGKLSGNVAFYWRVVAKDGETSAPTPAAKKDEKDKDKKKS